jgi:hypothetical protein
MMVLILQQLVYSILVGVADLFKVITALPLLLDHPPEGSVTVDIGTEKEPVFPPDFVNVELPDAVPRRHDSLTFNRYVTVVDVSDNRVAVTSPYLKWVAKLIELIKMEMASRNNFLAGVVLNRPGDSACVVIGVGFMVWVLN